MNLGRAIKLCRIQKNMRQAELAKRADLSVSYLSMLESGKRDPTFSTVENIAAALNVPLNILVFLAADKDDLSSINPELAEKLSHTAFKLIATSENEKAQV